MFWTISLLITAYLAGSIPFGLVLGKIARGVDIRKTGSGNIGTANAVRALGPFWGGMTLLGDALKATIPVLAAMNLNHWAPGTVPQGLDMWLPPLVGLMAVLGHNYSLFLGFTGGKGIATSFGVFAAMEWRAALIGFILYLAIISLTKISSLGSLTGSLSIPVLMVLFRTPLPYTVFAFLAVAMAFYTHRANIGRLIRGEERKITDKAKSLETPVSGGEKQEPDNKNSD